MVDVGKINNKRFDYITYIDETLLSGVVSKINGFTINTDPYIVPPDTTGDIAIFAGGYGNLVMATKSIDYVLMSVAGMQAVNFGNIADEDTQVEATSNGVNNRAVFSEKQPAHGYYHVSMANGGDATSFGSKYLNVVFTAAFSNGTGQRGLFASDTSGIYDNIEYITLTSSSNGVVFGSLTQARKNVKGTSNGTSNRGVMGGGEIAGSVDVNTIDYTAILGTGTCYDFGDLTIARDSHCATSSLTNNRGIFAGGASTNVIDYITITSVGNATDFGDLLFGLSSLSATSNGSSNKGLISGGSAVNVIQYITISSAGNALDFGDLTDIRYEHASTSNA